MRCLSLAEALKARGAVVAFAMRTLPGGLSERVRLRGFEALDMDGRLDISEAGDAAQTRAALVFKPDWIIVDHYRLGAAWETAMRQTGASIMAIDDLADRAHDCDVLLDQNLVSGMRERYQELAGGAFLQLLGPRYALLRQEYQAARAKLSRKAGPVRSILAYFGAADGMLTLMAARAFLSLKLSDVRLDVVLDDKNPQNDEIRRLAGQSDIIKLHSQTPDLIDAMASADLCLGASGATTWERLCMGLPAIVATMADNQVPIATELARRGLITWIGDAKDLQTDTMAAAIASAVKEGFSASHIKAMMDTVDGLGVERVCDALIVRAGEPLVIRKIHPDDKAMILEWANNSGTRSQAFNPLPITAEDHERWFAKRLADPSVAFFIAETKHGIPAGQVRFETSADGAREISYLVAPLFRGRGLGQSVLAGGLAAFSEAYGPAPMRGLVKAGNAASARIFRALGFAESHSLNAPETLVFELDAQLAGK